MAQRIVFDFIETSTDDNSFYRGDDWKNTWFHLTDMGSDGMTPFDWTGTTARIQWRVKKGATPILTFDLVTTGTSTVSDGTTSETIVNIDIATSGTIKIPMHVPHNLSELISGGTYLYDVEITIPDGGDGEVDTYFEGKIQVVDDTSRP